MDVPFVLSVEDNEGDFALIAMALRECIDAIVVRQIRDGEEAVAFFQTLAPALCPDLVLLDLNIPRRDGFEVLTVIRSLHVLRETPVVMFTSSRNSRDEKKALLLGANEYITKPLNLDAMMVLLDGVCARYLPSANAEATRSVDAF